MKPHDITLSNDEHGRIFNGTDRAVISGCVSCVSGFDPEADALRCRVVRCVNACAGMDDPTAALAKARLALEAVMDDKEALLHMTPRDIGKVTDAIAALNGNP